MTFELKNGCKEGASHRELGAGQFYRGHSLCKDARGRFKGAAMTRLMVLGQVRRGEMEAGERQWRAGHVHGASGAVMRGVGCDLGVLGATGGSQE